MLSVMNLIHQLVLSQMGGEGEGSVEGRFGCFLQVN